MDGEQTESIALTTIIMEDTVTKGGERSTITKAKLTTTIKTELATLW